MEFLESNNMTAVITGSSKGLGRHIATALGKAGYNIIIHYNKSKKDAELLEVKLSKITNCMIVKGDISKYEDASRIIKQSVKKFGKIDVLINNGGMHKDSIVSKMNTKTWDNVIAVNLGGVFNMSKAVLKTMQNQKFGRIINISSFTAFTGIPGASNYVASKAGIIGFAKSLAKEVAQYNITVNTIAPGYFDIGMFYDLNPKQRELILKDIPAKRLGNPNEISELIQIIISSRYTTGQTFVLDGGYSI
jgi:3-oxoacyl-[acyl-carrier protein] reductase